VSTDQRDDGDRDLGEMLGAYQALMDAIVPESQYWQGARQDDDRVARLSRTIEGGRARRRLRQEGGT
jgi:hypothetical protein